MAYSKGPVLAIPNSASLIPANLSVLQDAETGGTTFAVIHRGTVHLVHSTAGQCTQEEIKFEEKTEVDTLSTVTQARWCRLKSSRLVLVLASLKGYKICEWNGSNASNAFYTSTFVTPPGSYDSRFAKGIASIGNSICVGTSEGAILVLCVPIKGVDVVFTRQLQGHTAPVCDLATNGEGQIASSDENGTILVWDDPVINAESVRAIQTGGVPCVCLCFWKSFLIGGFSDGMIKIFNAESGSKAVEIAAHSRPITAMDVAHKAGLLLSVSEDGTASVWTLPTVSDPKVALLFSESINNSLLCGGRFCNEDGSMFAVTAYDSTEIFTFTKS